MVTLERVVAQLSISRNFGKQGGYRWSRNTLHTPATFEELTILARASVSSGCKRPLSVDMDRRCRISGTEAWTNSARAGRKTGVAGAKFAPVVLTGLTPETGLGDQIEIITGNVRLRLASSIDVTRSAEVDHF